EPRSYVEASKSAEWADAMTEEHTALYRNETWELVALPPGKKAISCRWVLKLKLNPNGSIQRHKARLVAKGYNQIEGWTTSIVFPRLKRSLYGLKQTSRRWNIELTTKLQEFGYVQCPHDHCLFLKIIDAYFVGSLVYVDDILLIGNSVEEIIVVKNYLHSLFTIKDLGFAKYSLGLELARSEHGLLVTQAKYLNNILKDTNLLDAKATSMPLSPGIKLTVDSGSLLPDPGAYRRLVGRFLYLGFTGPDVSFVV
ncbi:UNVERIFIED_CONTAM: Retrovirus-related Pol polyprotein from transposon RE2, partial [Sesamum radiatum]